MQQTFDFFRPRPSLSTTSSAQETDLPVDAWAPRSLRTAGLPLILGRMMPPSRGCETGGCWEDSVAVVVRVMVAVGAVMFGEEAGTVRVEARVWMLELPEDMMDSLSAVMPGF
jgi:hypothetical protein